jgi:anti-sigma B factor antagonist
MTDPARNPPARSCLAIEADALADGTLLLLADGDVDLTTGPELGAHLRGAVARELDVIVDVSGVRFMDSTGVAVLLNGLRRLMRRRRRLILVAPPGPVRTLLELTGLHDTFAVVPTQRAARAALRSAAFPVRLPAGWPPPADPLP